MTEPHDDMHTELMARLETADPITVDPPPPAGSTRFTSIKDIAMSTETANGQPNAQPNPNDQTTATGSDPRHKRRRFSGRSLALAAAAAIVAAGAGVALIPGSTSTAAAEVGDAAGNTVGVGDFRVTLVSDGFGFPGGQAEGEVDGENVHLVAGPLEFYRIGDQEWLGQNGVFESMPATESFDPFDVASEAVLTAALTSDDVAAAGVETLNGVDAQRYVIQIDEKARAALAEVAPESQYWFVGEVSEEVPLDGNEESARRFGFLEDADSIDVWVADGLIHQIAVDSGDNQFTWTFRDFGEDITITAPE